MERIIFAFLISFVVCIVLMPIIIYLSKKLKVKQTILHYVDNHNVKSGTPTMGGIGFIISTAIASIICISSSSTLMILCVVVMVGYGIVGFLDDFVKVYFKQNKGLSAYQKIIFQVIIAAIVSVFAYNNQYVGDSVYIPFTLIELPLGVFALAFYIVIFLSYTNAVNLTDGLDALAGKVSMVYVIFNALLIAAIIYLRGDGQAFTAEYTSLIVFIASLVGGLLAFLCFNCYPAKIFMGDTGALALGGAIGALAVVSGMALYSPIIGIIYLVTCLSVMIQVAYFKATKKRIFLMAPLHHHFERLGFHENQIVTAYTSITCFLGSLCVAITLILG